MALSVLSGCAKVRCRFASLIIGYHLLVQVVTNQAERDTSIANLLETLNDVYEFVEVAQPLQADKSTAKALSALSQQTIECGYFIQAYAKDKKFGVFALYILLIDTDQAPRAPSLKEHDEGHHLPIAIGDQGRGVLSGDLE
jgi:hypothetical protein